MKKKTNSSATAVAKLRRKPAGRRRRASRLARIVSVASWTAVLALWGCAASVYLNPAWCRFFGVIGLTFPFFLAADVAMFLVSLLLAPRRAWIPLVGLAGCILTVRSYMPFNLPSPAPRGSMKVLTYNVMNFGGHKADSAGRNLVCRYITESGADVVCMQEATAGSDFVRKQLTHAAGSRTPYYDTVRIGQNVVSCLSAWPIVGKELVCRGVSNGAAAFRLLLPEGDTLTVVNCHLESMHLSAEERGTYRDMVHKPEETDVKAGSRLLISKISTASVERARQADLVARFVRRHAGESLIVCGDFNDTPVSYTHRVILGDLTDAYRATGNGLGRSFNRDAIVVRIDNIFCSDHWRPFSCKVDATTTASDHYPVSCRLKRVDPDN